MKQQLVFATGNRHKLEEATGILGDRAEIVPLANFGCNEEVPEDADTLEENALQKARHAYALLGADCFADDTGLEITALGGEPGVRSARYAGDHRDSKANMLKVLQLMEGMKKREARFRCVIALIIDGDEYLFEGIVNGEILEAAEGEGGFGYDPIFRPTGHEQSFAEMSPALKNEISHRGKALRELGRFLNQERRRWRW
ncbi:MAG: RdgB/HAM1 family non-canonical purine NTP pyrophosphatase [Odoribacteraceae bacterium]|jgi:XTP/dITP diphosphohydrolase|nr:RdgB/HAM1 family non-canonical purine NTP pyrophosphatase [Odoribacteraceae bacterium]